MMPSKNLTMFGKIFNIRYFNRVYLAYTAKVMGTNAMAMENNANFPREKILTRKLDLTSLLYIFVDSWRSRVARSFLQIIIIIIYYFVLGLRVWTCMSILIVHFLQLSPRLWSLHYCKDVFRSWFIWGWRRWGYLPSFLWLDICTTGKLTWVVWILSNDRLRKISGFFCYGLWFA